MAPITIKSIAKMAGVSVATVSKIANNYCDISEQTRNRVLQIMKETGYLPPAAGKSFSSSRSGLIGVIGAGVPGADFRHPFFVEVLNAFKQQMGILGYDLLVFSDERSEGRNGPAKCRHYRVDGCIVIAGERPELSAWAPDDSRIPCIGIDIRLSGRHAGFITSDLSKMTAKVVEQFYLNGYRELGYIGGAAAAGTPDARAAGYKAAMETLGLALNEAWFRNGRDSSEESGYAAMKDMIRAGSVPRALFAASDLLAIGAMRAIREAGKRVPEDVAVIGCDDIEACQYTKPSLSTIRRNGDKIGKLAALMLFDLIHLQTDVRSYSVEPELILRESCC